jgi:plastocyanin
VRRALIVAAVASVAVAAWAAQAFGTAMLITASNSTQYDTTTPDITEGTLAFFQNNDPNESHTVTADDDGPDGKPLFRTGTVPGGGGAPRAVSGTTFLAEGEYDFHCSIHPVMQGTLRVQDVGGNPQPRPAISLKIKSKKLGRVVKSGKLKVKVEAAEPTMAEGIKLKAKKGMKGISKRKVLNLAAGGSKTVKLKLSKGGKEKLAGADSAKVKVEGTVDFGFGDKTSKKLK